jgi:phosphatidylserine/phosphatidylglycerophosphate/cardiolipin synthase-like enzyme
MVSFRAPVSGSGWSFSTAAPITVPTGLRYAGLRLPALRAQSVTPADLRVPAAGILTTAVAPDPQLSAIIEIQVNPFTIRHVVQSIPFGVPTIYLALDLSTPMPAVVSGDFVDAGDVLASVSGVSLMLAGQDRIARDAALWARLIDDAMIAVGEGAADWGGFVGAVTNQTAGGPNPPVLLLDHTGALASDGRVQISTGSTSVVVDMIDADGGDLQRAVARLHSADPAAMPLNSVFTAGNSARIGPLSPSGGDFELTVLEDGDAAETAIAVTQARRHVMFADLTSWFAPQYANPTMPAYWAPLQDYSRHNQLQPFVNGLEYYADLLEKVQEAADTARTLPAHSGLHLVGGWQTFPEAPLARRSDNQTAAEKPVTLLEAVTLLGDRGGSSRILSPKFFQFEQNSQGETNVIVFISVLAYGALFMGGIDVLRSDIAGVAILVVAYLGNGLLISWLIDQNGDPIEFNKDAVEMLGAAPNCQSVYGPHPAVYDDNPLSRNLTNSYLNQIVDVQRHFGFYHQKFGVVRAGQALYGYCGGIDINPNRLDDHRHVAYGPYHDIHARVEGPAARDVALSFEQRWSRDGPANSQPAFSAPGASELGTPGSHAVQVARTYFRPADPVRALDWAPNGDRTIADTLACAVTAAAEYIYIEEQYFTPGNEFRQLLVDKVASRSIKALIVTLPAIGDQPFGEMIRSGLITALRAADGGAGIVRIGYPRRHYTVPANTLRASSGRLVLMDDLTVDGRTVKLGPKSRIPAPPFWLAVDGEYIYVVDESHQPVPDADRDKLSIFEVLRDTETRLIRGGPVPMGPRSREHKKFAAATVVDLASIYVHAKSIMVDDVFVGIGSANINRRGHYHDGEMTLFCLPQRLKSDPANPVAELRRRLWAEMFDIPLQVADPLLRDPIASAALFDRSPLVGNRYADIEAYPTHLMVDVTGSDGLFLTLLKSAGGAAVLSGSVQDIYDGIIDPTSALEFD